MLTSAYTSTDWASKQAFRMNVHAQHTVSIDLRNQDKADGWKEAEHITIICSQTDAEDIEYKSKECHNE